MLQDCSMEMRALQNIISIGLCNGATGTDRTEDFVYQNLQQPPDLATVVAVKSDDYSGSTITPLVTLCRHVYRYAYAALKRTPGFPGVVLPIKMLLGMCRWMGSHFHIWTDYNGVTF